ncbi:hypothetical protein PINS_up012035 [Pythium insidiosum]|nr:hypothetical protein PINS_up012035 [Pythium insidiosum]
MSAVGKSWLAVLHILAGLFSYGVASLYSYLRRTVKLADVLLVLEPHFVEYTLPTTSVSYAIAVGHALLFVRIVWVALQPARRIVAPVARRISAVVVPTQRISHVANVTDSQQPFFRPRHLRAWWRHHTTEIAQVRLLIEIALQTFQAAKLSQLVATVWINRFMAFVIFANCWFTPVLHWLLRKRSTVAIRIVCLAVDTALDVVYCMVIPYVIFYPYYRDYIVESDSYPFTFYYEDVWYTKLVSELRQIFVTSWIDFISKMFGPLMLLYRLYVVDMLLTRSTTNTIRDKEAGPSITHLTHAVQRTKVSRLLDRVLLVWGLVVLAFHLQVSVNGAVNGAVGCLLEMRPWGSTAYHCAIQEVSCTQRKIRGSLPEIDRVIRHLAPLSVQVLILSNCDTLEVPPSIQLLHNLQVLKIYNSTIVRWDESAALRQETHPTLLVLYLPMVNMSTIPAGLLAEDFPESLWDFEIVGSNVTTFPPEIKDRWTGVWFFLMNLQPALTEFPQAVVTLSSLMSLYVEVNSIRSIPDHLFENSTMYQLSLDGSQLDQLPTHIGSLEKLDLISCRGTNVSSIPDAWLSRPGRPDGQPVRLVADRTPLCETLKTTHLPTGDPAELVFAVGWIRVQCATPGDLALYSYPLALELEWRRPNLV